MNKAFTKEDDGADAPVVLPRRRPLPEGSPNYVTPRGLALLRRELASLEAERVGCATLGEAERAPALARVQARLLELEARIAGALVVEPEALPPDEVRFGALVTVRPERGPDRQVQIVGVDEADAAQGRLAFCAPLARALLGKQRGEVASVHTPRGDEELEIIAIDYPPSRT